MASNPSQPDQPSNDSAAKPAKRALLLSLLGAVFGVQSGDRLRQDFSQRSPRPFILGGLIATLLFILLVWWLVQQVLSHYA